MAGDGSTSGLSRQVLQDHLVRHRIRHQTPEHAVFVHKRFQATGIRFIPPNLAFSLQNVSGLSRCSRHGSAVGKLASCSLMIPAIYASVQSLFLISANPSQVEQAPCQIEATSGGQVIVGSDVELAPGATP